MDDGLSPQILATVLSLVALIPVAVYSFDRGGVYMIWSVVSVLLIAGSLYLMFSPSEASAVEGASDV